MSDDVKHDVKDDVHWVDKGEAARELEVSLSTLDRMIRKGEVAVERQGRRVYVKLPGPRHPSDRDLWRQARARAERLERTAGELAGEADRLAQERDRAQSETATALEEYRRLEEALVGEQDAHQKTRRWAKIFGFTALGLLTMLSIVILVTWWLLR